MWLPFFLGLTQLHSGSLSMTPVGPETPRGDRWQVAALAQHPDTRLSALLLTRRLLASLTPGSVVVAAAADDRLQGAYQRFGFTRGDAKRVYRSLSGSLDTRPLKFHLHRNLSMRFTACRPTFLLAARKTMV